MASPTQQINRITAIWNEHLEVAKALPTLASAVSSAVDLIYSSMAAGRPTARRRERRVSGGCAAHRCRTYGPFFSGAAAFPCSRPARQHVGPNRDWK